ncbi:MAG TPA: Stk1 family PASTA domain-containing Ser/Thr kinase [Candidatus Rubrimentiphilum sp.]|nr:Stk1 family PASTA domain-containing Ser/Thr kinase [Candidatus Rubrimentiphilum sp.]
MIDSAHVFNNRYRLDNKLGEGGMATVYCGTDTLLRRRVAIKVLRRDYASDQEFVRRFYQEAESAAKLSHPNIVNTYDVGREGDTYYIVMELVDGPSLAEIIAADGRLPEPVALDYAAQVCNGLAYAHRQGLLHRDIKPANILITKDDVVKLSDFGIARAVSQQTMTMTRPGMVMGSVYYLSPEQAQGLELTEASDLYSVGIVLYQMLTGKLPFTGESPVTVALKHISDPAPPLDPSAGISPALASIVSKLLQKQPENRFGSASEVASALREARERPSFAAYSLVDDAPGYGAGTIAPQPPPRRSRLPDRRVDTFEEEPRRGPSAWMVALLALVLVGAAAVGYIMSAHPFTPVPQVAVANYVNQTDAQAQKAIVNAGLTYKATRETSDTVAPNHVIRQDPAPGSKIARGAPVQLAISSGPPTVGLRDVVGYTLDDAQKDLTGDKLNVTVVQKFDPSPKGSVIGEHPQPGTKVRQNAAVTLVVSQGPAPIKMPRLAGLTLDQARQIAAKDAFTINVSERAAFPNIAPNVIESQDVPAGVQVPSDHSTTVNVVVSSGGGLANVPNVIGSDLTSAQSQLKTAGFSAAIGYLIEPGSTNNGQVIALDPQPGTPAEKGSTIRMTLSVSGEVPDTNGMTIEQAKAQLADFGYTIGNVTPTTEGGGGKVVRTEPEAGTKLAPGSPVNIYVNNSNPP